MRCLGWGLLFAVFGFAANGCGQGGPTRVQGVVTLDGQPVENAMVSFVPAQSGRGKHATGRTKADGTFELTTASPNDGAFPGDYRVVVEYEEGTEVAPAGNVREAFAGMQKARQKPKKPPKYVIPAMYSDATKTVLKQKVPTGGLVELKLLSKPVN